MATPPNHTPTYQYYNPDDVPAPFGFQNTGVICWFNSLLQILLGLPSLNKTLVDNEPQLQGNAFALEYIKLIKNTLGLAESSRPITSASSTILQLMLAKMRAEKPYVQFGAGQECADEGLVMFIELLNCAAVEKLFSNVYELIIKCPKCGEQTSVIRDNSFRIHVFAPDSSRLATTEQLCDYLRMHTSEVDRFTCQCGYVMTKTKRIEKLKMVREVIILVFNKFDEKTIRWFPPRLSFKCAQGGTLDYQLVGKIDHAGTQRSGHYWAHSLRGDKWYFLNDNSVSSGSDQPEAATFIVAYHLVRPITINQS